jgi:hypothetical protein
MAAKARAVLHGRFHATTGDVRNVAPAVLRHRLVTTFNADGAGVRRDDVIRKLLEHVQPSPVVTPNQVIKQKSISLGQTKESISKTESVETRTGFFPKLLGKA